MLQTIRDKVSGWFAAVFLGAVAVVFIFWGIDFQGGAIADAARVNGEPISANEMLRAWQERQSQLQQMMRTELPDELVRSQQAALLDEHIRAKLLTQRAEELGFRVSDAQIAATVMGFTELQVDGQFSRDRYAAVLRAQGRTEAQFENELRTNLALTQLQGGITASAFSTPGELERRRALEGEQREIAYAIIPASAFATSVTVAEADIQSWYNDNKAQFMTPETVDVEYLDLRLADVEKEVAVTDEALRAYYETVKERFETQERRRGRHVLINITEQVDDAAALKRAEEVLAKARAGEDFGKLAQEYSEDTGSAAQGGDLGWATRGMFVGPFEDALFSMSVGELQGPIKTQFGYHVLRLDEIEAGQLRSFEDARAEIEPEFRRDRAQALFYERGQKMADESFAALTDLSAVATSLGMELKRANGFTRQGGGDLGTDQAIIDAAFSAEVADRGQNSALIPVGDDRALVLRVSAHHLPEELPLETVRAQIETQLRNNAAQDAAARTGNDLLARLEADAVTWAAATQELGRDLKVTPAPRQFTARQNAQVPPAVLQTAFSVPKTTVSPDKPVYQASTLDNGDFAVVAVTAVRSGNETPEEATARAQRGRMTAQQVGAQEFGAYLAELERGADIQRNLAVFQ